MEKMTIEEATAFFSEYYGGEHHIPGFKVDPCGIGWSVNDDRGGMATFDFSQLTRLVFMAHEKCVRVEVMAVRSGIIRLAIWKRKREGGVCERHPTLQEAMDNYAAWHKTNVPL